MGEPMYLFLQVRSGAALLRLAGQGCRVCLLARPSVTCTHSGARLHADPRPLAALRRPGYQCRRRIHSVAAAARGTHGTRWQRVVYAQPFTRLLPVTLQCEGYD